MPQHHHFILHKPFGFLSQFITDFKKSRTGLLGEIHDFPNGTMSVGRLDKDSEGLLLLTTDGKVSNLVTSRKVQKEYYAQVDGDISEEAVRMLETGVEIGVDGQKYLTKADKAFKIEPKPDFPPRIKKIRDERHGPTSWVSLSISEGKFRQVRKMTAAVGFPTLRLIRVRIGNIHLGNLKAGDFTEVENFDI